jgi:4-oxalocrotonate tautomerase
MPHALLERLRIDELDGMKELSAMPHVIVKLHSGRSEQQKARLAEQITKAVVAGVHCAEASVSVSIEDIAPADWVEKVYKPDIVGKPDRLYKKPGYNPPS